MDAHDAWTNAQLEGFHYPPPVTLTLQHGLGVVGKAVVADGDGPDAAVAAAAVAGERGAGGSAGSAGGATDPPTAPPTAPPPTASPTVHPTKLHGAAKLGVLEAETGGVRGRTHGTWWVGHLLCLLQMC
jgi:hypothetical protein